LVLLFSSCVNTVNRGHIKEDDEIAQIKTGVTTKSEVSKILGSPSSESSFGDKTWYYVSVVKENRSILSPKIVEQKSTEIIFDNNDVVKTVKQYSLNDSKNIEISKRITETEGEHLGFFEQIFANLGRFNKDSDKTSNRHGGTGGSPTGYPSR
ncbi:MAG: outer membrane protein assembly factor BamE, partial [Pseudomonadota bacterium]